MVSEEARLKELFFAASVNLSICGATALSISLLSLFPAVRLVVGPLPRPALVAHHYLLRAASVGYMSLATASRLVQLGLVVSFQRVVAVQEGRLLSLVVVSCIFTTGVHLLLEGTVRTSLGLPHISRIPMYVWLSQGECNPHISNSGGTGLLLLPHALLLLVTNLTIMVCRQRAERALFTRYRLALVNSSANGRLTVSAYLILILILLFVIVINPLFPGLLLQQETLSSLPPSVFLTGSLAFWLGCGSFLADTEPRQFILRRLRRAWAGWRAEPGGLRVGWAERWQPVVFAVDETLELSASSSQRTERRDWETCTGTREPQAVLSTMPAVDI